MKRSITALMVLWTSMFYALVCQAQILGTGQLGAARRSHTATLLQDGKILIVGGDDANGLVGQAEIFDPATLTSSNIAANPIALRTDHTATLLSDGRVLIAGGVDSNGLMASTEFYNPNSVPAPSFTAGPSLMRARSGHTATVLADGKILIAGGESTGSAEIFDPATQSFSLVSGHLNTPRQYHSAVLLNSGKVLIAGGVVGTNTTLTSAEIYDPQTQMFTPASGPMQTARGLALLRVLPDGKVQVIGGDGEFSMEMFDPATNSFIALAHIPPHQEYLNNILVSRTRSALITTIIQQNPVLQGQPELTADIIALLNRLDHTVTEIPQSNQALIAGGVNDAGQILSSATMVSSSAATITTDKFDYAPGEIVTIAGSGFQPNETVWMLFHEEPETHPDVTISSVADSQGNFTNTDFAPSLSDLNRNFTLTAIGQTSGFTTQTAFKDAANLSSISVGSQSGTLTYGTSSSATFAVTVNGSGNGSITIGVAGLPTGATFGPTNKSCNASSNGCNFTLQITTATTTPAVTSQSFTVTVTGNGSGAPTANGSLTINKASSTTTVSCPASVTYTGSVLTPCTATATGAGGLSASVTVVYANNINVGAATADATYAGDANHTGSTATQKTFTIDKASSTTLVTFETGPYTYRGTPFTATANVTGAGGLSVSVTPVLYTGDCTNVTTTNGCMATATFPGDTNHLGSSDSKSITITQASSTTTVTVSDATYDADPHGGTASVTGAGGLNQSLTVSYVGRNGTVYGPSITASTNAGDYSASASFAGDANHTGSSDSKDYSINKASSTTVVTFETGPYTYRGTAFTATAQVTGVGGLSGSVTVVYSGDCTNVTVANGCTATATFAGDANHNGSSDNKSITITKANATCTVNGYTGTYDGTAHGATGSCKGVDGTTVLAGLNLGSSFTDVPGGTANWSFTDVTGNYNNQGNSVAIVINKADANITVNGYTGVYDGSAHGATGSAIGVGGVDLSGSLNLGGTFTNVPGGTAHWTFTGGTNYNDVNGDVAIVINKANATINVVGYTGIYDGNAHGASGTATGVGGVNLSASLNLGTSFTIVPGGTAHWTFAGGTNYNDASGDVAIMINKADAIIAVSGYTGFYDGNVHGASGTATGLGGADLTGSLNLGATFTNAPGGTAHWTFSGGINYNDAGGDVAIVINQAAPIVSVTGGTFTDDAQPHGATGFAYGIGGIGDVLSPPVTFSYAGTGSTTYGPTSDAPSTPGTYLATATFAGNQNYTSALNSDSITIKNAAPQAQAQSVATNEDVPLPIMLRARDLDSANLNFIITSGPTNGTLGSIAADCTPVPIAPGAMSCTGTVIYTPNSDYNGTDSFKFKINDGELDSNEATVSITVYPVNDAPTATAQSLTTDDLTPLSITLTGTDIETDAANLSFAIVDAPMHGTLSGTPPNVTYAPNLNYKGPDSFTFTVTDRGDPDNCGSPSQTCADTKTSPKAIVSITVTDGAPPMTLISDLKPASLSNDRNPSFGFSGTDNVTDTSALSFECSLDAADWVLCGTAGNPTTSYSNLADGSHTFQVRAKDDSGNADPNPPSYTWIIDATPPDTVIDSQPATLVNSATATFMYHSTENNSTLWCSLDSVAAVDCTSSGTNTYTNLVDGQHTFTVAAKDQAGNVDPTAATVTWTIDTTAPHTTITSGPSNPTINTSATFVFSSANSPGDSYQCRFDGSPVNFGPCTSPVTYTGLSLGTHTFEVRGKDLAGNMETSPATFTWTIGQITLDQYTIDSDFKRFDGFDVVFGKGSGTSLKINSTNPDSFHYQVKLTNNIGAPISAFNGNMATAIITVPGMPSKCGGVNCSSQIGSPDEPAFVLKTRKVAHVWPGYHDRDGGDDDDDMPVAVSYMTLAQYQANGTSCADNSSYSSTMPANGAAKCIKITGFSIPVKHSARIRLNFQFRYKGIGGWDPLAQQLFYAGFVFRATTSVSFGGNSSTATASDATGLIGAGKKATAIGGYVFSGITPAMGNKVRLFTKKSDASCTVNTKLVAQADVDANGFYYIWRAGMSQQNSNANSLPSGVQYAVQLCDSSTQNQLGLTSIDSRLRDQEFEQIDFDMP